MERLVLWELRGHTGKPVTCVLRHPGAPAIYLLTVARGENEIIADRFTEEADALAHAGLLLTDFVEGGWTEVSHRDPRL